MISKVNGTDSSEIWIVSDSSGRRIVGRVLTKSDNNVVLLKDPMQVGEVAGQTNNRQQVVNLQFAPIFATMDIEQIEVVWDSRFVAPDEIASKYEEVLVRLKAARSGIETVSALPPNLPSIIKN